MAAKRWSELKTKSKLTPDARVRVAAAVKKTLAEMSLREMREAVGLTQSDVAAVLEKTQGELSRLERRDDVLLSSLREYVKALGGELELWAVLGDKRIRVQGV